MSYYRQHVFFCLNSEGGENCCNNHGATEQAYAKKRIKVRPMAAGWSG
jgi:hypothetical protein